MRSQDQKALFDFALAMSTPCDLSGFAAQLSYAVRQLIPCIAVGIAEQPIAGSRHEGLSVYFDPPEIAYHGDDFAIIGEHLDEIPFIDFVARRTALARASAGWLPTSGLCRQSSDFYSQRQFRETASYRGVFLPRDFEYFVELAAFTPRPGVLLGMGLQRDTLDFTARERALLSAAQPALARAAANAAVITRMTSKGGATTITLGPSDPPRIAILPEYAERLLGRFVGRVRRGRLPDAVERWLITSRRRCRSGDLAAIAPYSVRDREGTLAIHYVSGMSSWASDILVLEERTRAIPLTRRENEVLRWLADGKSNSEIGTILGASTNTVRQHLRRIFEKLGVSNRTAAAAWALRTRGEVGRSS